MNSGWLLSNVFLHLLNSFSTVNYFERNILMAFGEEWVKGRIERPFREQF